VFAEGLDDAAGESVQLAQAEAVAERQSESLGDQMLQTAAEAGVLGEALEDTADDATGLTASIGGVRGRLSRVAGIAVAATPPLLGLAAALGGVGAASGTIGAGVIGLSAAGLQSRAEETARLSDELETAADAREQLLSEFGSRLESAFDPLQNAQTEAFAFANLEAVVEIADNAADSLLRLQDTIIDVGSAFRGTVVDVSGAVFSELAIQAERLSPLLLQLQSAIRDLPGLIRLLGDAAVRLGPGLFDAAGALGRITAGLTQLGIAVLELALPPLNAFLEVVATAADLFRGLPDSLQLGIAAFVGLTAAVSAFSVAASVAAGAVTVLTAPISATVLAVAALTAGIVILLEELGLLEGTLAFITSPLTGFSDIIGDISTEIDGLVPDIQLLNDALEAVGLNAGNANEELNNLEPRSDGDEGSGAVTQSVDDGSPGFLGSFLANAGVVGSAGALLGGTAGFLLGGPAGAAVGGATGLSAGLGVGTAISELTGSSPSVDASAGGTNASEQSQTQPQQTTKTVNQNIEITVNGSTEPRQTRNAVRQGIAEATRRRRNQEEGRID
jgi:hypothetical protein